MSLLLTKAGEILEIAATAGIQAGMGPTAIVVDRQGGFRMMDATGWSLPAMAVEFGAAAVYRIERRGGTVRVEGWDGSDRCLLQRGGSPVSMFMPSQHRPALPQSGVATRLRGMVYE